MPLRLGQQKMSKKKELNYDGRWIHSTNNNNDNRKKKHSKTQYIQILMGFSHALIQFAAFFLRCTHACV